MKLSLSSHYAQKVNINSKISKESINENEAHYFSDKNRSIKKTYKYILVGRMIKVMLIENGVEKTCVKMIPIESAPQSVLDKLEDLSLLDMLTISELKNKRKKTENDSKAFPKEHSEYEKHLIYESVKL